MRDRRGANILGAFTLALTDAMQRDMGRLVDQSDSGNAALITIAATPGLSVDRLAKILRLSQPGTVRLVDRLQADGLVERRPGGDRRTLALHLTETGERQRRTLLLGREQCLAEALDVLSSEERDALLHAIEKILPTLASSELDAKTICRYCDDGVCLGENCPLSIYF
jgi:MarR family transcriptional repressor of emrRAB